MTVVSHPLGDIMIIEADSQGPVPVCGDESLRRGLRLVADHKRDDATPRAERPGPPSRPGFHRRDEQFEQRHAAGRVRVTVGYRRGRFVFYCP